MARSVIEWVALVCALAASVAALTIDAPWIGALCVGAVGGAVAAKAFGALFGAANAPVSSAFGESASESADETLPAEQEAPQIDEPQNDLQAEAFADALSTLAAEIERGNMAARLGEIEACDALKGPVAQFNAALGDLHKVVDETLSLADIAADCDLSARAVGSYKGDLGGVLAGLNKLLDSLANAVRTITRTSMDTIARSDEMAALSSDLLSSSRRQSENLRDVEASLTELQGSCSSAAEAAQRSRSAAAEASTAVGEGKTKIVEATESIERIDAAAKEIVGVLDLIESISQHTSLLAVNAAVEAARAGEAGKGFAVVTEEVQALSKRTSDAAKQIQQIVRSATDYVREGKQIVHSTGVAIDGIAECVGRADSEAERIAAALKEELERVKRSGQMVGESNQMAQANVELAERAVGVVGTVRQAADALHASVADFQLEDDAVASYVRSRADHIATLFERGLSSGEFTKEALFSKDYQRIGEHEPAQFMLPCVAITDRLASPILEQALKLSDGVAGFCIQRDDGYMPTHNKKVSGTPRPDDTAWNVANCRNRRFFTDHVALAAGANQKPTLLQVYRRDMGGEFVVMKDLSAPIFVNGEHWGALRLLYRSTPELARAAAGQMAAIAA